MITTVALIAWFARIDDPLQWQAVVAVLSAALGLTAAALVWRAPTRLHVKGALGVLGFSILRIGPPSDWTWTTLTVLVITGLLAIPLVRLLRALPPDA